MLVHMEKQYPALQGKLMVVSVPDPKSWSGNTGVNKPKVKGGD
jgi:hypothetical protein